MTKDETWKNVGSKIRHLRRMNQLTIRQLANGCDLSANAISLVERGEVAPSVATLCKIAHALGVSASSLFQEVCSPAVVLSRAGSAGSPTRSECSMGDLSCALDLAGWSAMPAYHPRVGKDQISEQADSARQTILCLSGCVTFEVDDQCFCLEPGDQLSFNGEAFHRWHNTGVATALAILILPSENMAKSSTGD